MPTATASSPAAGRRALYENGRPPLTGACLLIPAGVDCVVVADPRGLLMLPVGGLHRAQSAETAARRVLTGPPGTLRLHRREAATRCPYDADGSLRTSSRASPPGIRTRGD